MLTEVTPNQDHLNSDYASLEGGSPPAIKTKGHTGGYPDRNPDTVSALPVGPDGTQKKGGQNPEIPRTPRPAPPTGSQPRVSLSPLHPQGADINEFLGGFEGHGMPPRDVLNEFEDRVDEIEAHEKTPSDRHEAIVGGCAVPRLAEPETAEELRYGLNSILVNYGLPTLDPEHDFIFAISNLVADLEAKYEDLRELADCQS